MTRDRHEACERREHQQAWQEQQYEEHIQEILRLATVRERRAYVCRVSPAVGVRILKDPRVDLWPSTRKTPAPAGPTEPANPAN